MPVRWAGGTEGSTRRVYAQRLLEEKWHREIRLGSSAGPASADTCGCGELQGVQAGGALGVWPQSGGAGGWGQRSVCV